MPHPIHFVEFQTPGITEYKEKHLWPGLCSALAETRKHPLAHSWHFRWVTNTCRFQGTHLPQLWMPPALKEKDSAPSKRPLPYTLFPMKAVFGWKFQRPSTGFHIFTQLRERMRVLMSHRKFGFKNKWHQEESETLNAHMSRLFKAHGGKFCF